MGINIDIAEYILAIAAFATGTLVPLIYLRFFFDGISIKQPFRFRLFVTKNQEEGQLFFGTVVKIANIRKNSILIDNINIKKIRAGKIEFIPFIQNYDLVKENEPIFFPIDSNAKKKKFKQKHIPFIIKSDQEWYLVIEVIFKSDVNKEDERLKLITDKIGNDGLRISFRINGLNRQYKLRIQDSNKATSNSGFYINVNFPDEPENE